MKLTETTQGFVSGLIAYGIWGLFPLFFHLLRSVPVTEILMHRVIWSFAFVSIMLVLMKWHERIIQAIYTPGLLMGLVFSSLLISVNWLVFIWAVSQARVVECSLGYFITPLVSAFLAFVFLKESLNRGQLWAIAIACCGVAWLIVRIGYLPWVSLTLAVSFGLYGLVRKKLDVDTLTGLTIETAILLPLALLYWLYLASQGDSSTPYWAVNYISVLLMVSGIVTALPLLFFAFAARRLELTVVGFMLYITPTMQFLGALLVLHEPFSTDQLIGFCFIWCALIVFTFGAIKPTESRG